MNRSELITSIRSKASFLCVGLDTDLHKLPASVQGEKDPVFAFNKAIIDATADVCVAYKPNIAFYEAMGPSGWESLARTIEYIPEGIFKIADAKRGDIGNTADLYARTFFETYSFDAVTVAPYMGHDSVSPFLNHAGKWTVLLALTSNPGAHDFQQLQLKSGDTLFEKVLTESMQWGTDENLMYVVGATQARDLKKIRAIVPDHFLLVPGVGAQGGSLEDVVRYGMNRDVGLLVNSSRGIIYASSGADFAEAARREAHALQQEMGKLLEVHAG
ncbi:MAG: orotidine-5'-phosphate decarboxylase [Flavobacteriales bacterium]|nr:orotidine-5'-phosphate decarboxylase [Flavobacteriales bacterium]MCB9447442.1 orotidine-5'-phosphate decarboxylase [Flavobacteriales bacterium]